MICPANKKLKNYILHQGTELACAAVLAEWGRLLVQGATGLSAVLAAGDICLSRSLSALSSCL